MLFSSSILGTYPYGKFILQHHIFLPFHAILGVLKARILNWFSISFASGPCFVRTLHHDLSDSGNQDGSIEGHAFIFWKNIMITTSYWATLDRKMLYPTQKYTSHPRAKEKPQEDSRGVRGGNLSPTRDSQRVWRKLCLYQDQGERAVTPTRDWARPAFEYLRCEPDLPLGPAFDCGGTGQQPASGTGALATADLEGATCGVSPLGRGRH